MNEIIVSRRQIIEHNRSIRYELNICIMQTDKLNLISVSDICIRWTIFGCASRH